jgi:hypothetical protein
VLNKINFRNVKHQQKDIEEGKEKKKSFESFTKQSFSFMWTLFGYFINNLSNFI